MIAALTFVVVFVGCVAAAVAAWAFVELVCRAIDGELHGTRGRPLDRWQ